jgi:hypothetical protein
LAIDLVPTDTGIYDPFKVDAMAEFLGFDHFNFSQSVVETYSGVPMNQAVCELSPFGAHVIGKIDPKTGQIDPTTQKTDCDALKSATGTYVGGVLHDDPINGGGVYWTPAQAAQNPGSLTDCPNAPQGARFSFVDSLVGVDKLGKVTPIGQMGIPWITGTDFVWHYDGADGWDAPLGVGPFNAQCHEIGAVFPTILEASSVVGIGVGTSTFDRFINFADLPVTQQTKVAEPFSLAVFVLGLLGLGYIRVTSHRGRFFDGGAHPMEFQPSSI